MDRKIEKKIVLGPRLVQIKNLRAQPERGNEEVGPLATVELSQQHPNFVLAQSGTFGRGGAGGSKSSKQKYF